MTVVIMGRSGSGKSLLKTYLIMYGFVGVTTCTTRPMREYEIPDTSYHFLSSEQFRKHKEAGDFVETTEYNGYEYGTLLQDLTANKYNVVVMDPSGARAVKERLGDDCYVVYIMVNERTSRIGLKARGESQSFIEERVELDESLFSRNRVYDFVDMRVYNDGFINSADEVAYAIFQKLTQKF